MIGFKSIGILVLLCCGLIESYKLAFDNGNSVVKMESNRIVNGKVVGEPKPEDAIKELTSLGFKVSKIESGKGDKGALKMLRAKIPIANKHSSMEIRPSEPIEQIFKKISHLNEPGSGHKAQNQNNNQNQNLDLNQATNVVSNQLHDSKEIRQNSGYDIYITNVNENINVNNNTAAANLPN